MPIIQLLFSFRGRINRARYWILILSTVVLSAIVNATPILIGDLPDDPNLGLILFLILAFVIWLLLGWIMLAAFAKRLHDRDMPAWVLIPLVGIPVRAALARYFLPDFAGLSAILGIINGLAGRWILINLGCIRGSEGLNQYGPDPLQPAANVQPA